MKEKTSMRQELKHLPFFLRLVYQSSPRLTLQVFLLPLLLVLFSWTQIFFMKRMTDAVLSKDVSLAFYWGLFMLGSLLAFYLVDLWQDHCSMTLRLFTQRHIESYVIERYCKLPFARLEDPHVRDVIGAFHRNTSDIIQIIFSLTLFLQGLATMIGLLLGLSFIPFISLVVLVVTGCVRAYISMFIRNEVFSVHLLETRNGKRAEYFQSSLIHSHHNLLLRSLGIEMLFFQRWIQLVQEIVHRRLGIADRNFNIRLLLNFVDFVGFIVCLYFAGRIWMQGLLDSSALLVLIATGRQVLNQIGITGRHYRELRRVGGILPVIVEISTFEEESKDGIEVMSELLTIEFQNVSFRYPGTERDILKGVSFSWKEGERLALIGLNGAGKTTLLNLLMRIYEPTSGMILVNGKSLSSISRKAWRAALSFLTQHVPLFDDLLEEQVKYGDYQKLFDEQRFQQAVHASGLDLIAQDFPLGLKTHAGRRFAQMEDKPIELSGGQNQITAIARTLYRDARFYIFDEPTSAVDAEKEERFFERLPEMLEGKGVIFVSHRFSTLRRASRILVLDDGRLIEEGTHEELMALKGRYAELFALQAKAYSTNT